MKVVNYIPTYNGVGDTRNKPYIIAQLMCNRIENIQQRNHGLSFPYMSKSLIDQWSLEIGKEEVQHKGPIIIPVSTSHIAVVETAGNVAVIGCSSRIDLAITIQIAVNQRNVVCLWCN